MTVKTGTAWAGTFVTEDATGALATPSTGPAGVLYVDGVANAAAVTITGSNPYKFAVTLPSLTAGQRVDMYITATIDGIATAGIVASEQADTTILSDGVVVNSGTVTTLTNLPAITANWLTAAGIDATAVTELQAGLALEATLTAIKGDGWTTETLAAIDVLIDAIKAKTDTIGDLALKADLQDVEDKIDVIATDTTTEIPAAIAGIPAAVWGYATRTLSSFGTLVADIWGYVTRTLSTFGFTVATNSDANVTAIKAKTDLIPASPAPANEYDARMAAIQADLDNPAQYKADVSGLATAVNLATVDGKADAIKLKTDLIPASPAPANEYDVRMAAIQADLDNADQYKADVSGLATTAHVQEVEDKVDNLDGDVADVFDDVGDVKAELDLVYAKTNNLPTDPADQSAVEAAITAAVTSVKGADGDTLKVLSDQIDGISSSAIADAVWDEATGDHVIVGSTGETLANIDVSGVADAVWDELLAGHVVEGSAGKTLLDIDPDTLADSIYDELSNIPAISLGVPANGEMDIYIADSLHVSISDLGSLADLDKLYVSFKERYDDEDSESILQLEYGQGLLYVNGETATVTDGSITIDDAVDGDITIDIVASVMDDITVKVCVYDVKIIRSAGVEVQTLHQGKARFHRAITRAIS